MAYHFNLMKRREGFMERLRTALTERGVFFVAGCGFSLRYDPEQLERDPEAFLAEQLSHHQGYLEQLEKAVYKGYQDFNARADDLREIDRLDFFISRRDEAGWWTKLRRNVLVYLSTGRFLKSMHLEAATRYQRKMEGFARQKATMQRIHEKYRETRESNADPALNSKLEEILELQTSLISYQTRMVETVRRERDLSLEFCKRVS